MLSKKDNVQRRYNPLETTFLKGSRKLKKIVFTQGRMVDALTPNGDEGRSVTAKSFGEVCSNL